MDIKLTSDQSNAINAFLDFLVGEDNFFVIQGAAGTGKSFLIQHLIETFYSKYSAYCLLLNKEPKTFDIQITATTNKAVSVINEFLASLLKSRPDLEVNTIFSLLGLRVVNDRKTGKTTLQFGNYGKNYLPKTGKEASLIFIDECSFIGDDLHEIIESVLANEKNTKIVYIGDPYQLAPVGQTFSAMDFVSCNKVVLNEVIRNSGDILLEGTKFRRTVQTGKFTPILFNNTTVCHVDGAEFKHMVESSFSAVDWHPSKSKILAWTNQRVQEYNTHIRSYMQRPDLFEVGEIAITNEFIKGNRNFSRSVDSLVLITNVNQSPVTFYDVEGHMVEIDHSFTAFMPNSFSDVKRKLKELAKDKDWRKYFEIKETWLDLRAPYASSVHKAQGSTYETVFIDLADIGVNWSATDVARLLYVSITRASKKVVCFGYLPDKYC